MSDAKNRHVQHRIRSAYHSFKGKERKIADYILVHQDKIVHSSITQTAEDIGVAEATVFRFCKKIGFKGYQALKIALAAEVVEGLDHIHETIQQGDDGKTVSEKVFHSNTRTLEATLQVLDGDDLNKAVEILVNAHRIEFFGSGGSGVIAQDAHHKFMRTGIPSGAATDAHFQVMSASQLNEKAAAVLISHSGANRDILDVLEIAKEKKVKTIGITSLGKTPLSEQVDVALCTVSAETDYRSEALASRLAQLSLIDALFVNVCIRRKDDMQGALNNIRRAISMKRI